MTIQRISAAIFFFFILSSALVAQQEKTCLIAKDIVLTSEKYHYSPISIDDSFSERVFNSLIKQLDPHKIYLSKEDIDKLGSYKFLFDEAIQNNDCSVIDSVTVLMRTKIDQTFNSIKGFKASDLIQEKTTVSVDGKKKYLNQKDLLSRWKRNFYLDILTDYFLTTEAEQRSEDDFQRFLPESLLKKISQIECIINKKYQEDGKLYSFVSENYLDAIATAFDPHNRYFNVEKEKSFSDRLSKKSLSYGIDFYTNEDEELEVYSIAPGSAAWRSQKVNEGDILKSISINNVRKELKCVDETQVEKLLASSEKAVFYLKKAKGVEFSIQLEKSKIDVVENAINGYILEGKQKLGYLYLPSFYTDEFNGRKLPNGCANDVAKELIKLNREGVQGLILDLRDNGGGSMLEAIRMAGIFINFGAIAIRDTRDEKPFTLKDMDRGMAFSKPLLVLVNGYSASASELFAATIQDYNRGIIVGASTFGKGTIQRLIPVDAHKIKNLDDLNDSNTKGYLKVTTGKFFRITGESHQNIGVSADIKLLSENQNTFKEGDYPTALANSSIDKKTYYSAFSELPLKSLIANHTNRQTSSEIAESNNKYSFSLSYKGFESFYNSVFEEDTATVIENENGLFKAALPPYRLKYDASTDLEKQLQQNTKASIEGDPSIFDAYLILNDLITINSK